MASGSGRLVCCGSLLLISGSPVRARNGPPKKSEKIKPFCKANADIKVARWANCPRLSRPKRKSSARSQPFGTPSIGADQHGLIEEDSSHGIGEFGSSLLSPDRKHRSANRRAMQKFKAIRQIAEKCSRPLFAPERRLELRASDRLEASSIISRKT
jgi:hypothetical protein